MAKMAKMILATRNPVFCELMRAFLWSLRDLSAKNQRFAGGLELADSAERRGLHQDTNYREAD
jgi:hypothetical protein